MKKVFFFIGAIATFAACSPKVPFTEAIRQNYNLTTDEIKQIQFYTSGDIVLVRGTKENDKDTYNHTLTVTQGKRVEEVDIPKGTPGLAEIVNDHSIKVSFENGSGKSITFGVKMNSDSTYKFIAEEWKDDKGKILYDGRTFFALKGAENVQLLFKLKSLDKNTTKRRVVGGKSYNILY